MGRHPTSARGAVPCLPQIARPRTAIWNIGVGASSPAMSSSYGCSLGQWPHGNTLVRHRSPASLGLCLKQASRCTREPKRISAVDETSRFFDRLAVREHAQVRHRGLGLRPSRPACALSWRFVSTVAYPERSKSTLAPRSETCHALSQFYCRQGKRSRVRRGSCEDKRRAAFTLNRSCVRIRTRPSSGNEAPVMQSQGTCRPTSPPKRIPSAARRPERRDMDDARQANCLAR